MCCNEKPLTSRNGNSLMETQFEGAHFPPLLILNYALAGSLAINDVWSHFVWRISKFLFTLKQVDIYLSNIYKFVSASKTSVIEIALMTEERLWMKIYNLMQINRNISKPFSRQCVIPRKGSKKGKRKRQTIIKQCKQTII